MSNYDLSPKVDDDLDDIAYFTYKKWGYDQSERYLKELYGCFEKLAENPEIGRDVSEFLPDLRRFNHKAHSIFYVQKERDILIVRILGQQQDFERHL